MFELKRIGLFCGCFNPIHSGHIRAAELFRSAVGLECVFLVPANVSYHKFGAPMESGFHRLKMCELAVEGHAGLAVCDFEIKAPKAPYTIDTVLFFKNRFPDTEIYLCMGEDTAQTAARWACFEELKDLVRFLVINREDRQMEVTGLLERGGTVEFVQHEKDGISSTDIRKKLRSGVKTCPELDEKVFQYIRENALYGRYA